MPAAMRHKHETTSIPILRHFLMYLLLFVSPPSKWPRNMRVRQFKRHGLGPDKARGEVRRGGHSLVQGVTVHSRGYIK